ncbi:hypothetical protein AB0387_19760 [Streptomyces sp. NPDC089173]|uniref:hypothetical protein n=1 Tax=Streptomyces sp. NPDC089173 TaxID=3154965 RepID=UPI00344C4448
MTRTATVLPVAARRPIDPYTPTALAAAIRPRLLPPQPQSYGTEQRALAAGRSLAHHYGYERAVRDTYMIPKADDVQILAGRYMIGEF